MNFDSILNIIIPFATAVAGFFTGKRKQKNDFLKDLQASVNMLVAKNKEQVKEIIELRDENANLEQQISRLQNEIDFLKTKIIPKKPRKNEVKG
ncbi:MAG: hypothetical protein FWF72_02225 [Paludibacter sp.]|nr:hypothetical protein [Paludibacter sp.]